MLSENLLYDPHYNMMSVQARELFVRLLIKTDDFGVIPGEDYTLGAILNLDEYQKKHLEELIGEMENMGLITGFMYHDKPFLMMKRDRFDEYQAYIIKNRTQSEYLREKSEVLEDSERLQEITGNYWKFRQGSTLTHRKYKVESNKYKVESNKSEKTNLVDELINLFADLYQKQREIPYLKSEKDKKAVGMMLSRYRKANPESDTDKCRSDMTVFFNQCLNISNKWLYENMTLAIINSKINEIRTILRNQNGRIDDLRELQQALDSF